MQYALSLATDKRVLHATYDEYAPPEWPRVEELPMGDVTDYKYIDGQYIYDPCPKPEPPALPQPTDTEARLTALEEDLAATKILLGVE